MHAVLWEMGFFERCFVGGRLAKHTVVVLDNETSVRT